MGDRCEVRTRVDYRSAPIQILEDSRLSAESKLFATWALMHGNGWQLRIAYALAKINVSRSSWTRKIRRELMQCGYFVQEKKRGQSKKNGRQVFEWENLLTDAPLFACTHLEHMQNKGTQIEAIQDEDNTSTPANKEKSLQKKKREKLAEPPCSLASAIERLKLAAARVKNADHSRDAATLGEALALIERLALDEKTAMAALSACRWPSEAAPALLAAAEDMQRQQRAKDVAESNKAALLKFETEMRQKLKPADPVATASRYLPGLGRGFPPLASPTADGGQ